MFIIVYANHSSGYQTYRLYSRLDVRLVRLTVQSNMNTI